MRRECIAVLAYLVATATAASGAEPIQAGGTTPQETNPAAGKAAAAAAKFTGEVVETMDAGRYTYVRVDTGAEKIWAAAPQFQVEVGDDVMVPDGSAMMNYHSQSLDRTFDLVYFVAFVAVAGEGGGAVMPSGHAVANRGSQPAGLDLSGIERAEGGKTVGEIFDEGAALAGREIAVRGRVVKFTPAIMGKNWIHLQDGTTGAGDANDLTVTGQATAEVGDTVLVRGVVSVDRDFGFGYKYDLIIEDADITVE